MRGLRVLLTCADYISKKRDKKFSKITFSSWPDDQGFLLKKTKDGNVMLAHTRLSIIDLSKSANQPMISRSGRFILSFNGEIYNYREIRTLLREKGYNFETSSDTEVLLNAWEFWGEYCLEKLTGMFAFAIFDQKKKFFILQETLLALSQCFIHSKTKNFSSLLK